MQFNRPVGRSPDSKRTFRDLITPRAVVVGVVVLGVGLLAAPSILRAISPGGSLYVAALRSYAEAGDAAVLRECQGRRRRMAPIRLKFPDRAVVADREWRARQDSNLRPAAWK